MKPIGLTWILLVIFQTTIAQKVELTPYKLNQTETEKLFDKSQNHGFMTQFTYCDYEFVIKRFEGFLNTKLGYSKMALNDDKGIKGVLVVNEYVKDSVNKLVLKAQVFDNANQLIIKNVEISAPDSIIQLLLKNYWKLNDSTSFKHVFTSFQDEITYSKSFRSKLAIKNTSIKSMAQYGELMNMDVGYSTDAYFAEKYKTVKIESDDQIKEKVSIETGLYDLKLINRKLYDSLQFVVDRVVKLHMLAIDNANFQIEGDYSVTHHASGESLFDISQLKFDSQVQLSELFATIKDKVVFPLVYVKKIPVSYIVNFDIDVAMRFGNYTFDIGASGSCEFPDPKPCTELWSVIEEKYRNSPKGSYDVSFKYTALNKRILDSEVKTIAYTKKRTSPFRNMYITPIGF